MKKAKVLLASILSLALLLTAFGPIHIVAEKTPDPTIPTVNQWVVQDPANSHVTAAEGGGVNIKFDMASAQTSIGSAAKYKLDGLHIRLEDITQPSGAVLFLSSVSQTAIHYPPNKELQINILGNDLSLYGGGWMMNPHPFMGLDLTGIVDVSFKKSGTEYKLIVNGQEATLAADELAAAEIGDEVYVGFLNCFTDIKAYDFDVTIFHGGDVACNHGGAASAVPTVDQWSVQDTNTSHVTAAEGGGVNIKFDMASAQTSIGSAAKYKLDGLHIRLEDITQPSGAVLFLSSVSQTAIHYPPNKELQINILGNDLSLYGGGWSSNPHYFTGSDLTGTVDVRFEKSGDDYKLIVNGQEATLAASDLEAAEIGGEVYVGFLNCFTDLKAYDFDVTLFHGGDVACNHGDDPGDDPSGDDPSGDDPSGDDPAQPAKKPVNDADFALYAPNASLFTKKDGDTLSHFSNATDGGVRIKFDAAGNTQTCIASKNKYKLDGLHLRFENIKYPEGVAFYISSATQFAKHYPSGTELQVNILEQDVSVYGNAWGNNDHPYGAGLTGLSDVVDVHFSFNDYGDLVMQVNDYVDSYTLIKDCLNVAQIGEEVYVGFLNCFTVTKEYDYYVTVLHGGDVECKSGDPALSDEELQSLVQDVHDAIDALKTVESLTLADEEAVVAARAKADALKDSLKEKLNADKMDKLAAAEAKIAELKQAADAAGEQKAREVVAMIEAVVAKDITLDSEAAIVAAEEAYASLSAKHQALVSNFMDLALARMSLDTLKEENPNTPVDPGKDDTDPKKDPVDPKGDKDVEPSVKTGVPVYTAVALLLLLAAGAVVFAAGKKRGIEK